VGDGLGDGIAGDPDGDVDDVAGSLLGAGPSGWAPPSAQAVESAATVATIAIKRFMGCLLFLGDATHAPRPP
jgi:hypothetical protein